jgi:pyridoxamine 5'-phosphate oxidase family protein
MALPKQMNLRGCAGSCPSDPAPTNKGDVSMSFTDEENAYLQSQPVTRFATVGPDGQPDVVPLAFEFDGHGFWVGGVGDAVARTRKFRNVAAGNDRVALVFDDLISIDPFAARCVRVYGRASEPVDRTSALVGPGRFMRITPTISWSWNLEGEPAGATWYEPRRTIHTASGLG